MATKSVAELGSPGDALKGPRGSGEKKEQETMHNERLKESSEQRESLL